MKKLRPINLKHCSIKETQARFAVKSVWTKMRKRKRYTQKELIRNEEISSIVGDNLTIVRGTVFWHLEKYKEAESLRLERKYERLYAEYKRNLRIRETEREDKMAELYDESNNAIIERDLTDLGISYGSLLAKRVKAIALLESSKLVKDGSPDFILVANAQPYFNTKTLRQIWKNKENILASSPAFLKMTHASLAIEASDKITTILESLSDKDIKKLKPLQKMKVLEALEKNIIAHARETNKASGRGKLSIELVIPSNIQIEDGKIKRPEFDFIDVEEIVEDADNEE